MSGRREVVVAHSEPMLAEGIAAALARYPGVFPVAAVTTAVEAERAGQKADAIMLDARLDEAAAVAAKLRRHGVRVVMLSAGEDGERADPGDGVTVSTRESIASLVAALAPEVRPRAHRYTLTPRQREVLSLIAEGLGGKQVARQLGISEKTVERHKTRIFSRLEVPNQTAAVSLALRHDLTGSAPWNRSRI